MAFPTILHVCFIMSILIKDNEPSMRASKLCFCFFVPRRARCNAATGISMPNAMITAITNDATDTITKS